MNERERALEILRRIEAEGLYAAIVLGGETGFVRTLVLGILRWRAHLDYAIEFLAKRRLAKLDPIVVDILRIGLYQLRFMDVAKYAAVSETVDLAGRRAKRARGFVNAILRRASEKYPEPVDLPARLSHPQWLLDRWTTMYGAVRAEKIAAANQELSYPDVLVLHGEPPPGSQPSTLVPHVAKLTGSTAELDRQNVYPMDEGSAVIAAIAAASGSEVLDLAAAPGGKSLYMTHAGARVVSNDVSVSRLQPLFGRSRNIVVSDGRAAPFSRRFPTVLLDAPCSATGTIRKNPELKWRLRQEDLAAFTSLQTELLTSALQLTSGVCIYSTCSLEPEENDGVVEHVLNENRDFERDDIGRYAPSGGWIEDGILRLTPESGADGFTAFAIRRTR